MQPNLSMVLEQVGKDKGIDKKVLVQTVEQAILTAAKKVFGLERELEAQLMQQAGRTADYAEGVRAFLEKRKPVYTGA